MKMIRVIKAKVKYFEIYKDGDYWRVKEPTDNAMKADVGTYDLRSNKDNFENENSIDETFYFEYYNSDYGDWEDMELTVMQDSESGKFQWIEGDGAEESDFIFNSPKQAVQDYKKFVKSLGNKVRGL